MEPRFPVSREAARIGTSASSTLKLLSDAEFLEDGAKDVLDVHPAEQPAQGISGSTQLFGGELFALFYKVQTPAQTACRAAQQIALASPGHHGAFAGSKKFGGECHESLDQLGDAIAPARRDPELAVRTGTPGPAKVDLVAHNPDLANGPDAVAEFPK